MAEIIDINEFVGKHKLKEVTNPVMFYFDRATNEPVPTKDGLFSYEIFGPLHSEMRNTTWAYVGLGTEIVHPVVITMFEKVLPSLKKIAFRERKYILDPTTGVPVADDKNGEWGVQYVKKLLKKIKWENVPNYDKKRAVIDKLKSLPEKTIFINKWLIMPAGLRDFAIRDGRVIYDEINDKYQQLLQLAKGNTSNETLKYLLQSDDTTGIGKETAIQRAVSEIHNFFLNKLSNKSGLVRGALIKKRVDFVARLVASALPEVPPHAAVIPWGALINVFAPFIIHEIENDGELRKMIYGENEYVSFDEYSNNFQYIFKNMPTVSKTHPQLKSKLIQKLEKILNENELMIALKRDPAFGNTSWHYLYPIINTSDVYNIIVNSLYYAPLGGDSFNCFTIFYKEGNTRIRVNNGGSIWFANDSGFYMSAQRYFNIS